MTFKVYIQELIMARIFIQTLGIQKPADLEDGNGKTFFVVKRHSLLKSVIEHSLYSCFVLCITRAVQSALTQRQCRKTKPALPA